MNTNINSNREIEILSALYHHLKEYSRPNNEKGFLIEFYEWVIFKWNHSHYFEIRDNLSYKEQEVYPRRTSLKLKEVMPSYDDFLASSNGRSDSLASTRSFYFWTTMEKELFEFFHESIRSEALRFLSKNFCEIDAPWFWDRVFLHDLDPELDHWSERFERDFGFFANFAKPYSLRPMDSDELRLFAQWQLQDFEIARSALIYKDKTPQLSDLHS